MSRVRPALAALAWLLLGAASGALAQVPGLTSRSYITPFPPGDQYALGVFGDALAEGLVGGLDEAFAKDASVKTVNFAGPGAALTRPDSYDLAGEVGRRTAGQPVSIMAVLVGINDARSVREGDRLIRWGDPEWRAAYGRQIDRVLGAAKAGRIAVYWIGLPVMSDPKVSEQMQVINEVIRERTYLGGAKFIDTFAGFTDQFGGYAASGADMSGQTKRLREADGVLFTKAGYRKLAHYLEVILRRDIAAARAERNVPLAGDADDLAKLVRQPQAGEADPAPTAAATPEPTAAGGAEPGADGGALDGAIPEQRPARDAKGDLAEDEAEAEQLSDVQPQVATPSGAGYSPGGELIAGDITTGVTGLASISPVGELSDRLAGGRRPADAEAYARALVRGEPLAAKPGRADDFVWRPAN